MKRYTLNLLFLLFSLGTLSAQSVIYVDADAAGNNDGSSWTDAYNYLQDALAAVVSGDEIWVAEGTYYPDEGSGQSNNSRSSTFKLVSGVSVYGGFSGVESSRTQAIPSTHTTILSGELNQDGNWSNGNSYNVVYAYQITDEVTLDGFTIQDGYGNNNGNSKNNKRGGGLHNRNTEDYLTVSHCTFRNNYGGQRGGGAYNGAHGTFLKTTYLNCIFEENRGHNGGGAYNFAFNGNRCDVKYINCIFDSNNADNNGGAVTTWGKDGADLHAMFTNCTFYNNNASADGDALRCSDLSNHYLTNCIVWQNGTDEWETSGGNTYIAHSIVNRDLSNLPTGTTDNGNNSNSDPLFEDAANGDFRLQDGSPAINAGDNGADLDANGSELDSIAGIAGDILNQPRIEQEEGIVDLGPYENPYCDCNHTVGTNAGAAITTGVGNAIYGEEAGVNLSTGSYNSLMGYEAGYNLTTADSSVMVGYRAGFNTTTGNKNIFMGHRAGEANTIGHDNIFLGSDAGRNNTSGHHNIIIGEEAGQTVTTGFNNIIIGEHINGSSSAVDMTGRDNIFIGTNIYKCSSGSFNIAIGQGYGAGAQLTTGTHNVFYGYDAASDVKDGSWNTCVGYDAGYNIEHADYNTCIGGSAGWETNRLGGLTTANYNTYVGDSCGYSNREGQFNVGLGANAGSTSLNRNADNNTFIGAYSTVYENDITLIGYNATALKEYAVGIGEEVEVRKIGAIGIGRESYINGDYGIGIGYDSEVFGNSGISIGYQASSADNSGIAIGKNALASGGYSIALGSGASATGYNSAAIGYGTSVSGNHEIVFGNDSTATIGGTVDFTALSDGRFKTNIEENIIGLDFIRQLRPVTYQLTFGDHGLQSGFIAQEVEQAAAQSNFTFSGIDYRAHMDRYGLRYAEFVVPLVKALQELAPQIERQREVIQEQNAQLDNYKAELLELAAAIKALEE
ncbi:MAG: tail fiber domain-containing protein [Bacteroidota bacterium]